MWASERARERVQKAEGCFSTTTTNDETKQNRRKVLHLPRARSAPSSSLSSSSTSLLVKSTCSTTFFLFLCLLFRIHTLFMLSFPMFFYFLFFVFWSIPTQIQRKIHIHHYDYLLQLKKIWTAERRHNRAIDKQTLSTHTNKHTQHSQRIAEQQHPRPPNLYYLLLLQTKNTTTTFSHDDSEFLKKLSNRIWTLKKKNPFLCVQFGTRQR